MKCIPIVMVKNEANYIRQVLAPLVREFPVVLMADTGSTDGTAELAESMAHVQVLRFGEQTAEKLGQVRKWLCDIGKGMGYAWALLVDGDELWSAETLRALKAAEMPEGKRCGFTTMVTIDHKDGDLWEMADSFNRLAVFPTEDEWKGEYPFEWPISWQAIAEGQATGEYFAIPDGWGHHALHLHRLVRSPLDADVYRRQEKQYQYAMRPVDIPFKKPLEERWKALLSWP